MRQPAHLSPLGPLVLAIFVASCGDSGSGPGRPGPPVAIRVSAGNDQTGGADGVLPGPLAAKVIDAKGLGVPNVDVAFQAMPGSGTVNPTSSRTNGAGVAITSWTLPQSAGVNAMVRAVLVDTLTGALVDTVTFTARVVGGAPTRLAAGSAPDVVAAGTETGPLSVYLLDKYYNRSPGVRVTWTVTGGGTLSATSTLSDSNGVASVVLTTGSTASIYRVTATVGTLTAIFTIEGRVPGQPAVVGAGQYRSVVAVGETLPLRVTVTDGLGTPVPSVSVTWTVVGGGGTLATSTSVTNANGVATVQFTAGSELGQNTVQAQIGSLTASFSMEGRFITRHLAELGGTPYGIARSSGGRFAVVEMFPGALETFEQNSPETKRFINLGGAPVTVAMDDAGALAYVSNMDGSLQIVSLTTNLVVKQLSVPGAHSVVMSPAGDRVYVGSTEGRVYAVSTTSREIVGSVSVPNGPWGFAFRQTATDSLMYVTARDGGSVTEVDMKSLTVLRTIGIGGRPHGLAISPDGRTLYAADEAQGLVKAIDIASGSVTATAALIAAFGICISPDGSTLFATSSYGKAAVISTSSMAITKSVDTFGSPRQVVVAPSGAEAYAANEGGWVDIIAK